MKELYRQFTATKQQSGESISIFLPRIRKLLSTLYGVSDTPDKVKKEIRMITDKLRPEYQMDLARTPPTTIDELRAIALQVENGRAAINACLGRPAQMHRSYDHEYRQHRPRVRFNRAPSRYPARSKSPRPSGPFRSPRRFSRSPRRNQPNNYQRSKTSYKGFQNGPNSPAAASGNRPRVASQSCFRCGKEGHWARDCKASNGNNSFLKRIDQSKSPVRTILKKEEELSEELNSIKITKHCGKIGIQNSFAIEYPIECNGIEIKGLIDTGSQVTVVDEKLVRKHGWKITHEPKNMTGAGGNKLNTPGSTILTLAIKIGQTKKEKKHLVAVVKDFTSDLLIGLDLLANFQICINTSNQTLRFEKGSIAPEIRTIKRTIIPPRTQKIMAAKIQEEGTIMTVPFYFEQPQILVGNAIAECKNNEVDIIVCNPTTKKVVLPSNMQLATYEKYEDNESSGQVNSIQEIEGTNINVNLDDELTKTQNYEN